MARRRFHRCALHVLIAMGASLTAGVVISLAVAVAFALWGTMSGGDDRGVGKIQNGQVLPAPEAPTAWARERFQFLDLPRCYAVLDALPPTGFIEQYSGWGVGMTDTWVAIMPVDASPLRTVFTHEAGWPLRALKYRAVGGSEVLDSVNTPHGWHAPAWLARERYRRPPFPPGGRYPVPLTPIPLGLAADTALFGGIAFGLYIALGSGRRAIRRLRGRCPSCGYSRAGLAAEAVCPECGQRNPGGAPT